MTSFGSHRRNTDRSLKVSISSYRHRSDLVRCGNGSGKTTVVDEEHVLRLQLTALSFCHFYHLLYFNFNSDAAICLQWQKNNKFTLVINSASHRIFLLVLGAITAAVELHRLVLAARIWMNYFVRGIIPIDCIYVSVLVNERLT